MENDERYSDVPDNWEEASDSPNKALEAKIIEAKLKQADIDKQGNEMECRSLNPGCLDVQRQGQAEGPFGGSQIRILKRPESTGELSKAQPSSESPYSAQQNWKGGSNKSSQTPAMGAGSTGAIGTKSLEERVTAYAQARERIFGVIDQAVHEDLPLQPKLLPRSQNNPPPTSTAAEPSSS